MNPRSILNPLCWNGPGRQLEEVSKSFQIFLEANRIAEKLEIVKYSIIVFVIQTKRDL